MTKFEMNINCENASFEGREDWEVAAILRKVADVLEEASTGIDGNRGIRDTNGNTVGSWSFINESDD